MLTVLESINLSAKYLSEKGIESSRLNAEMLLAEILKCKRLDLYLKYDRPLTEDETRQYRNFISRRSKSEPLQYIVGKVEFYGIEFSVNPSVLIPRQETEILVDIIIAKHKTDNNLSILDVGTGSGIIPVCLVKNLHQVQITATDISESAISTAKYNAEQNNASEQIEFVINDILKDKIDYAGKFDIVVSNPPYVSLNEYRSVQPEIKNHEPDVAVTDYGDGYTFYKSICSTAKDILKENGRIYFELGEGQSGKVDEIMKNSGFAEREITKDYLGIDRVICGVKI